MLWGCESSLRTPSRSIGLIPQVRKRHAKCAPTPDVSLSPRSLAREAFNLRDDMRSRVHSFEMRCPLSEADQPEY